MCPAVSGEKFSPTENAGYSACRDRLNGKIWGIILILILMYIFYYAYSPGKFLINKYLTKDLGIPPFIVIAGV
jgi:hypothetical protein